MTSHTNESAELNLPTSDLLTTLPYFGSFVTVVEETIAANPDRVHAIVRIDIDGFGEFNKQRGHLAGDQLLREMGECIARHIRTEDTATHEGLGGFLIFLDDVDPDKAHVAVERIRSAIYELHSGAVRLSCGIALHDSALDATDTMATAAQALHNAKLRGGDRVEVMTATASAPRESRPTVLIVDDDERNRKLFDAYFREEEYRILTADAGLPGLSILNKTDVDAVLLDLMLPDIDGIEVCRRIKNDPEQQLIPVIMVTAWTMQHRELPGLRQAQTISLRNRWIGLN